MDSLDAILNDLTETLDVELQEGRRTVELPPGVAAEFLRGKRAAPARPPTAAAPSPARASATPAAPQVAEPPAAFARGQASGPASGPASDLGGTATPEEVAARIAACTRCGLHATRTRTVPGVGRMNPDILFIGEAPGADEDAQGIPFVGRAGQLLTRMIEAMGYTRDEVFIANILKCRPPGNRPPTPEEMEVCLPFLRRQIALVKPKVIVALGTTSVQGLLRTTAKISSLRNQWHAFEGIPLMPTFHPSYLLRFPAAKRDVWIDLQAVLKHLGRTPPPRPSTPPAPPPP